MAIRVMLDTDVLEDLDGHFELLATYTDLIPDMAALEALRARFPHSEVILIDRALGDPTGQATIADIEPRAMTVEMLPEWIARKAGMPNLTGYSDRNDLPAVEAIVRHGLYHWVATLDGTAVIAGYPAMHGPAAVQILGEAQIGIHGDLSLVYEDGWHHRKAIAAAMLDAAEAQPEAEQPVILSEDLATLAGRAGNAWELNALEGGQYVAQMIGKRDFLIADSVPELEARIRQLYPDTIT